MNEIERGYAFDLALGRLSRNEFFRIIGRFRDEKCMVSSFLHEAKASLLPEVVECALIAGFNFGFSDEDVDVLIELLAAEWHFSHEDIVLALGDIANVRSLDSLVRVVNWIPDYLKFDENRALARKALWSISKIPGDESKGVLRRFSKGDDLFLKEVVKEIERESEDRDTYK